MIDDRGIIVSFLVDAPSLPRLRLEVTPVNVPAAFLAISLIFLLLQHCSFVQELLRGFPLSNLFLIHALKELWRYSSQVINQIIFSNVAISSFLPEKQSSSTHLL
jgi:hypothetical protein